MSQEKETKKVFILRIIQESRAIEIFKGLEYVTSLRWSPGGNEIFFSAILITLLIQVILYQNSVEKIESLNFHNMDVGPRMEI